MNKFQKVAYKIVKYEEKTGLWEGKRAKYKIGRSIPSTIRIYVKASKEQDMSIKEFIEMKNQLNWL